MAKRIGLPFALMAMLPCTAIADDLEVMQRAGELGSVLAAETFCGLVYDQTAIQAWVTANIPPEDMGFPSLLNMTVMGAELQQKNMSSSAKTAHCAAIIQTAAHYGFIKG